MKHYQKETEKQRQQEAEQATSNSLTLKEMQDMLQECFHEESLKAMQMLKTHSRTKESENMCKEFLRTIHPSLREPFRNWDAQKKIDSKAFFDTIGQYLDRHFSKDETSTESHKHRDFLEGFFNEESPETFKGYINLTLREGWGKAVSNSQSADSLKRPTQKGV